MKKLIYLTATLSVSTLYAQDLTEQVKGMLTYDNIDEYSTYVKKEDYSKCYEYNKKEYSLLALAIKMKGNKFISKMIEDKADLNIICDNKTPLMYATKYGQTEIVKTLLKAGAVKNKKSNKGQTALDYAKKYDKPEIIELLKN